MLRLLGFFAVFLLSFGHSAFANSEVTLRDVVEAVLTKHLVIEKRDAQVQGGTAQLQQAGGEFDWNIFAEAGYKQPRVPGSQNGLLTTETTTNDVFSVSLGAQKRFRNGIAIEPGVSISRNYSKDASDVLADSVTVGHFKISVPMLQGFGEKSTSALERAARQSFHASELDGDRDIAETLVASVVLYWQNVAIKRNIDAMRRVDEVAKTTSETVRKLSEQGELPSLEYQRSNADLNLRRLRIEKILLTWNSTRRELGKFLNGNEITNELPTAVGEFPVEIPEVNGASTEQLIQLALDKRRDLRALERQLDAKRSEYIKIKDGLLPKLDLNIDIDRVSLNYAQSIGNNVAKGRKSAQHVEIRRLELQIKQLRQDVSDEVSSIVQRVRGNRANYMRAKEAYNILAQITQHTREQVEQGAISRGEYLAALDELSNVEHIINEASVNHVIALAQLRLATGTLPIGSKNIETTVNALITVPNGG